MRLSGNALVHGLTITNGTNKGRTNYASGVRIGSLTSAGSTVSIVSNCVIAGCYNSYTNAHGLIGGAAFVFSDGLLVDSVVRGNEAVWRGAGVTMIGTDAEARGCVIEQNISTNDGSAGVWGSRDQRWVDRDGGRLVDCVVQTNVGNFSTGVTYVRYMEGTTVRGNVILENQHSAAGGTFGGASGFMVTNCTIEGNLNPGGWAAGVNANHSGTFVDTWFIRNRAGGRTYNHVQYGAGGLLVNGSGRTVNIERCTFANNVVESSSYTGGAIEVLLGMAVVSDCVISNNTAWRGGGVAVNTNGTLRMSGTLLRDNRGTVGAGLVMEGNGVAYLNGCTFEANAATNNMDNSHVGGGGIFLYNQGFGGFCSVSNSVFAGNTSKWRAGGMGNSWNAVSRGEVVNCVFTNNTSVRQGGGLVIREDTSHRHNRPFLVRNSLFAFNKTLGGNGTDANGGAIHFVSYNDIVLDSCTIVSNDSGHIYSGGVHHRWGGTITNCVIAFNTVKGVPEDTTTSAWSMSASCYQNCCIYPGVPSKFLAENGCVNADPLFADPDHGDFTLRPNSPCRNLGLLEDWMADTTDLAGSPRVSGKGVDMGCYELFVPSGLFMMFH